MANEIPSRAEADQLVNNALLVRHQDANAAQRGVLARVTLGALRMLIDPTGGILGALFVKILGLPPVADQVAQRIVDYWRAGVLDAPPFPQRPQMWPLVAKAFHEIFEPTPGNAEVEALINIAIGLLKDQFPNQHGGVTTGASAAIVRAYAIGV